MNKERGNVKVFTLILVYSCFVSNSPISMMMLFDKKKQSFMMAALLNVTLSDLASINYSGYTNAP